MIMLWVLTILVVPKALHSPDIFSTLYRVEFPVIISCYSSQFTIFKNVKTKNICDGRMEGRRLKRCGTIYLPILVGPFGQFSYFVFAVLFY